MNILHIGGKDKRLLSIHAVLQVCHEDQGVIRAMPQECWKSEGKRREKSIIRFFPKYFLSDYFMIINIAHALRKTGRKNYNLGSNQMP